VAAGDVAAGDVAAGDVAAGDVAGNVLVASNELLLGDPALARSLTDAYTAALAYAIRHPDEAGPVFARRYPQYPARRPQPRPPRRPATFNPTDGAARRGRPGGHGRDHRVLASTGTIPAGVTLTPEQVVADGYLRDPP
jgi:ABC-type nitrate/sulfonate/bicarbonate transport system substrate-binding protein